MSIYSLPPDEMVRDLINRTNNPIIAFDQRNLIFGKPSTLLGGPEANTMVNVRGVQGEDYLGQLTLAYNRLDLGVLFQGNYRPEFTALGQSNLHRLLPDLNKALGITLTEKDIQDVDLKLLGEGDQVTIEIRAKPGSLAYQGFTRVLFNRRQLLLTDVVSAQAVDDFMHPDPVIDGYRSAGLLTWGLDFTIMAAALKVWPYGNNYKGRWANETSFRQGLSQYFGIEDWPPVDTSPDSKMRIRDYATKDIADANRNYSRVVVQTHLRSNGYSGTAFFHYNV